MVQQTEAYSPPGGEEVIELSEDLTAEITGMGFYQCLVKDEQGTIIATRYTQVLPFMPKIIEFYNYSDSTAVEFPASYHPFRNLLSSQFSNS